MAVGLTPPAEGVAPGCYKLPYALRRHGLLAALAAEDGSVAIPPRYLSACRKMITPRSLSEAPQLTKVYSR